MADHEQVILAAISAAGPRGNVPVGVWRSKVAELIPDIIAETGEGSVLWWRAAMVIDAQKFVATLVSYGPDEKTGRLLVIVRNTKGEEEQLRTEWATSAGGMAMARRLKDIPIGSEVLVWRHMEKLKKDAKKETRVLSMILMLKAPEAAQGGGRPPTGPSNSSSPRSERPPAGAESSSSPLDQWGLTSRQLARVATRCRGEGIASFHDPAPEDLDRVLVIATEEKQNP